MHQFPLDKFAEDSMRLDYILCDAKLLLLELPGWLKIASLVRFNRAAFSLVRWKTQKNSVVNNCVLRAVRARVHNIFPISGPGFLTKDLYCARDR